MTITIPNITDFMKASPFDTSYDLGASLTPEFFYEHLHVKSDSHARVLHEFHDKMFNKVAPDRVVFVKGFAGNGKTTFIHSFIREHPDYHHVYCDFQNLRKTDLSEDPNNPDEVKLLMNRFIRKLPNVDDTFRYLDENCDALKDDDFISSRLHKHLGTRPADASKEAHIRDWMDNFDFKDIFTCLFVHLFRERAPRQKTIVYFDNLDVPRMEYVADRFLLYFQDGLNCAGQASRHQLFADRGIDFQDSYRFVICLREVNEAILNAHLGDRLGFARSSFPLVFDAKTFSDIAAKRIDYLEKSAPQHDRALHDGGRWSWIFRAILNDEYFRTVFLPLYNYNYRELSGMLVSVIAKHRIGERDTQNAYRLRGMLMFGIVNHLIEHDFLNVYRHTRNDKKSGYCFIDRVLLTVLINGSNYTRRIEDTDESDDSDPYGLAFLVKDLRQLYDVHAILTSVARCFLSHRVSRIHLLTVLNTKIDEREEFVREMSRLLETADAGDAAENMRARNDVRSTLLKVNPAGFTCVRYILPHFEFYSNLVNNSDSLYRDPLRRVLTAAGHVYAFQEKIDKVRDLVEEHLISMKKFFDRQYTRIRKMNAETFPRSVYCFRHEGLSRVAKTTGHSHTIKILTSHIGYLDRFRQALINRHEFDDSTVVNEALVSRIRGYVRLFRYAVDRAAAQSFADQFEKQIVIIEQSGYTDRTTKIELERSPFA